MSDDVKPYTREELPTLKYIEELLDKLKGTPQSLDLALQQLTAKITVTNIIKQLLATAAQNSMKTKISNAEMRTIALELNDTTLDNTQVSVRQVREILRAIGLFVEEPDKMLMIACPTCKAKLITSCDHPEEVSVITKDD